MTEHRVTSPLMSDRLFKLLRRGVEYVFPATIALYFALSEAWNWGYQEQTMASLAAVNVFLAAVVGISRNSWKNSDARFDGDLVVDTRDPDRDVAQLDLTTLPESMVDMNQVTFRVKKIE